MFYLWNQGLFPGLGQCTHLYSMTHEVDLGGFKKTDTTQYNRTWTQMHKMM